MEGWERVGSGSPLVRRAGGGGGGRWSKMPEPLYSCCLGGVCILVLFLEFCCFERRLRWLGHVCRMDDNRPQKQLLYGELASGCRPVGRPKLRFKDSCKSILKSGQSLNTWQTAVKHRTKWCKSINSICECLNNKRILEYERRRAGRRKKTRGQTVLSSHAGL